MDGAILLIVAVAALGAFVTGIVLLVLYFRSGREDQFASQEPVVYGNLVQCPQCGYMNPLESAACLNPNCRAPLPHPQYPTYMGDQPQPPQPPQPAPPRQQPPQPPGSYAPPISPSTPPPPDGTVQSPSRGAGSTAPAQRAGSPAERPPGMPNAWLEGLSGVMQGKNAILHQGDTLVGRSTVCDVQVYDPKVSRKHFRIRFGNGAFYLQDQQSSRGTTINGQRVMAQRLYDGDQIMIGDTMLVFHVDG